MIDHVYFCAFFFFWKDCSISSLSANGMTVNVEPIAFNIETTIDRDYSGGKRAARFNIFLEFYCFNQFHPNKSRILNGFLRWMRTTNSPGKDMCIENIWTATFSLGTLCYFMFFFLLFLWPLQTHKTEKRLGEVLDETLVHMLYFAHVLFQNQKPTIPCVFRTTPPRKKLLNRVGGNYSVILVCSFFSIDLLIVITKSHSNGYNCLRKANNMQSIFSLQWQANFRNLVKGLLSWLLCHFPFDVEPV